MNPYQPPRTPPPPSPPPPPPYYQQPPVVQHVVHYHQAPPKSPGVAVALEILPGFFFQTFGIGQMYAGNVGVGLLFMFGYWLVLFVNILLCFIIIGFFTTPLCWILTMILSSVLAASTASKQRAY